MFHWLEDILHYLEEWFKNIANRRSRSKALISPRRMGKSAVLDRFVNLMFWRDYGVVPFYINRVNRVIKAPPA